MCIRDSDLGKRHAFQNAQVCGVRVLEGYVFDDGHLALNHILPGITFVGTPVDDGDGQRCVAVVM